MTKTALACAAGTLLGALPGAGSAHAETVTAGVCWLDVSTGTHEAVPVLSATVNVEGTGSCKAAGSGDSETGPYVGELLATVTLQAAGCFSGADIGSGTFTLSRPGFPGAIVFRVAVVVAGALVVTGVREEGSPAFAGGGVFAPRTGPAQSCTSVATQMQWKGPFAFGQATLVMA